MNSAPPYDHIELLKGFKAIGLKQEQISQELGVTQGTISRWLSGQEPGFRTYFDIVALARKHGIIGDSEDSRNTGQHDTNLVEEVFISAGMGGGGLSIIENTTKNGITFARDIVRDHWRIPTWVLNRFNAKAEHIACFPSQGDSMLPTINDGDVIFIDTRHQVPSPPGIYALIDEFGGLIAKRLEIVSRPKDDPIIVRVSSDNPKYTPQDLTTDEIHIVGRYIGRFAT